MKKIKINYKSEKAIGIGFTAIILLIMIITSNASAINIIVDKQNEKPYYDEREYISLNVSIEINEPYKKIDIYEFTLNSDMNMSYRCKLDNNLNKLSCDDDIFLEILSLNKNNIKINNLDENIFGYGINEPTEKKFIMKIQMPEISQNESLFDLKLKLIINNNTYNEDKISEFLIHNVENLEDFKKSKLSKNKYSSGLFLGNKNIYWNYIQARSSNSEKIENESIILRSKDYNSSIFSQNLSGNINELSFEYKKAFSYQEMRKIGIYINEILIDEINFSDDEIHSYQKNELNISGPFNIKIKNNGKRQVIIDNIRWK